MGSGASLPVSPSDKHVSGTGKIGYRPIDRSADTTGPLDTGCAGQQCLVNRGFGESSGSESVPAAIFHQLQLEEGLVHHLAAYFDSELGSDEWKYLDGAV